ncbi:hypothetical protein [Brumimicrobium aurantiacum]|uniref:tRNA (Guanine-N1)-methyltransferase n=1 Tax=Brumimicrobium aurantiacum TaxID=1737063 RepID=A0A3E1F0B8_9FLAO|nr:hypothetical protein [Brumimicrobium aurantiacum]RFC55248.1 hypothetical protein DXU93_05350 [Brumimicrobium aurantiacum]
MKKNILFLTALLFSLNFASFGQDTNSIDDQFSDLINKSNSYQSYKVIDKTELGKLQNNIHDSIANLKETIKTSKAKITAQKNKIDSISNQVSALEKELTDTKKQVETIDFVGIPTHKVVYNSITWGIIGGLMILSLILFVIFNKSNRKTKEAKEKLQSTENDLVSLRKRSLEKEQQIKRELQDEINKNRQRKE